MIRNHWVEEVKKRLDLQATEPSDVTFERLEALGIINDRGEVTGHLHRWDAFLAIAEVKPRDKQARIQSFRCLMPVFGLPGGALIDISRSSLVDYLKQGKKVITAHRDNRLGIWKEGCDVHLSEDGFVVCGHTATGEDNVGDLPEFR
jgi:hypothetical protein